MFSSLDRWSQCNKLALKVTCVVFGGFWEETATQSGYISDSSALSFSLPLPSSPVSYPPCSLVYLKTWTFNLDTKCAVRFYTLDFWVFVLSSIRIFSNGRTFRIFFSFFLVSMVKWYKQPRCHLLNFQLKGLVTDNQKQDFGLWLK